MHLLSGSSSQCWSEPGKVYWCQTEIIIDATGILLMQYSNVQFMFLGETSWEIWFAALKFNVLLMSLILWSLESDWCEMTFLPIDVRPPSSTNSKNLTGGEVLDGGTVAFINAQNSTECLDLKWTAPVFSNPPETFELMNKKDVRSNNLITIAGESILDVHDEQQKECFSLSEPTNNWKKSFQRDVLFLIVKRNW